MPERTLEEGFSVRSTGAEFMLQYFPAAVRLRFFLQTVCFVFLCMSQELTLVI